MLASKREQIFFVLLLAAVILAYGTTLANGFAQDDQLYILRNRAVTAPSLKALFTPNEATSVFRPVTFASLAANWALQGNRPLSYHAVNLVLHAGVTLLLYLVLRTHLAPAAEASVLAFVSSLLFAVHPIHTEAVASIVGRAELFAAGFFLAAWLLHLQDRPFFAIVCFVLAVLSKESAVAFLPLILVTDYTNGKLKPLLRYLEIGAVTVVYLLLLWKVGGGRFSHAFIPFLDNPLGILPAKLRVLNALRVAWKYVALQAYPGVLSSDYSYNEILLYSTWRHLFPALLLTLCVMGLWVLVVWKKRAALAAAGAIYSAGFAVTANLLIPTGTIMGERLAYLPSAGFCLLIAVLWFKLAARKPAAAWVLLGVVAVALGARTIVRNRDWRDDFSLWTAAVRAVPGSAKAHESAAVQYGLRGEYDVARSEFEEALRIYPDFPAAYESYGLLEASVGHDVKALDLLKRALAMSDKDSMNSGLANVAVQLMKLNQNDEALALLNQDIAQFPEYARAWSNRAVLHYRRGETPLARTDAQTALRLDPENTQARNLLQVLTQNSQ